MWPLIKDVGMWQGEKNPGQRERLGQGWEGRRETDGFRSQIPLILWCGRPAQGCLLCWCCEGRSRWIHAPLPALSRCSGRKHDHAYVMWLSGPHDGCCGSQEHLPSKVPSSKKKKKTFQIIFYNCIGVKTNKIQAGFIMIDS